jgi:hypothetical protein
MQPSFVKPGPKERQMSLDGLKFRSSKFRGFRVLRAAGSEVSQKEALLNQPLKQGYRPFKLMLLGHRREQSSLQVIADEVLARFRKPPKSAFISAS